MSTLMEKLAAARAAQNGTAVPPPAAPVAAPVGPTPLDIELAEEAAEARGVVPPDAPPRAQVPATAEERQARLDADFPPPATEAAPAPKKRGRPRKNPESPVATDTPRAAAPPVEAEPWSPSKTHDTCRACGGWVRLNADRQFSDHIGVDANFVKMPDQACVGSGDTPGECVAWCDKRTTELAATGDIPEHAIPGIQVDVRRKITARVAVPTKTEIVVPTEPDATDAAPVQRTRRRSEPLEVPTEAPKTLADKIVAKRAEEISGFEPGLTIYVDCLPTKGSNVGQFTMFEDWIAPIIRDASEANNVSDYRMVPYTTKGILATAINANRKVGNVPPVLVIMSHTGGADVALECLIPFASNVIRALRG